MVILQIIIVSLVASIPWIVSDILRYKKTITGYIEIGDEDLGTETPIYNVRMGSLANISKKKYVLLEVKKIRKPEEIKNVDAEQTLYNGN